MLVTIQLITLCCAVLPTVGGNVVAPANLVQHAQPPLAPDVVFDLRTAATHTTTLSVGLMSAAMSLLAWFGAVFVFILGRDGWRWRVSTWRWLNGHKVGRAGFTVFALLSVLALIGSIFFGGQGLQKLNQPVINQLKKRDQPLNDPVKAVGEAGKWGFDDSAGCFDWQGMCGVLALSFFIGALLWHAWGRESLVTTTATLTPESELASTSVGKPTGTSRVIASEIAGRQPTDTSDHSAGTPLGSGELPSAPEASATNTEEKPRDT